MKIFILTLILLINQINTALAITIFDPKRGVEPQKTIKVKKENKIKIKKAKVTPLYMKLLGITKINDNVQFKLFDMQVKKRKIINWNSGMKDQIILKDFYKINRIEYDKRSIVLIPKFEVKCQEKPELNLSCNEKNEFVLKLSRNKPTPSKRKANRQSNSPDRLAGKRLDNPFAKAIKKQK